MQAGSYFVACAVFSTIYGKPAPPTPVALDAATAAKIRAAAWCAVAKR